MAQVDINVQDGCYSTQLIDGDGEFNVNGLHNFINTVNLHPCGLSYAVVAIMGPQSSGKSTLLNHLFYTSFKEMDAFIGRNQTTKGIWIAKAIGIEPTTLIMDLEGTDGRERGENDTTFEKQSALFALAIADIVLINMWCHDIGREQAANRPLLKTVFQVMMRLFSPRKSTLLFVIRDKTKTPMELLEPVLRDDIQKIWNTVSKTEAHKNTPLSEFFNVEVTALSSYEEKEEQFKDQVAQLRERFFNSISPKGLAGDRRGVIPASGFAFSAQQIWKIIKENKDLDLPAHKIMVATVRCEEIAYEKFNQLTSDKEWLALEKEVPAGIVPGFGTRISSILDSYLSGYDLETLYFEESVRKAKRQLLLSQALQLIHPVYLTILGHLRNNLLESFKTQLEQSLSQGKGFSTSVRICTQSCMVEFDKGCLDATIKHANFDYSKIREKLLRDIKVYSSSIRSQKLSKLMSDFERDLSIAINEPVGLLFEACGNDTWRSIRKIYKRETETCITRFSKDVTGFELDKVTFNKMVDNLKSFGKDLVVKKAREESGKVLIRMKDRFANIFSHDNDYIPRIWTGKENIKEITKEARFESLKLLAMMAIIRLEEKPDRIENILFSNLMDQTVNNTNFEDPLASSTWEEVPPENTLITPVQCKTLWKQFKLETEYTITQAISAQEAYKCANNRLPPLWAILAMIILGFNEFMLLLRNPLYPLVLFVIYLLGRAIWVQMDISREFQHGFMGGIISCVTKFIPTLTNLLRRLSDEAYGKVSSSQRLTSTVSESGVQHSQLIHRRVTKTKDDAIN